MSRVPDVYKLERNPDVVVAATTPGVTPTASDGNAAATSLESTGDQDTLPFISHNTLDLSKALESKFF